MEKNETKKVLAKNHMCYYFHNNLVSLKSGVIYIFSHYFAKIKVDSYDSLPVEKTLTAYKVIIVIKLVLNKDNNYYYCKIF